MFKGSLVALVTPMTREGVLDEKAFRDHVEWQIGEGTQGFIPVGTTGESPTLSHAEHDRVVELCVEVSAGRVPVMAGAGSNSTAEAIELTRHAKEAGAAREAAWSDKFAAYAADARGPMRWMMRREARLLHAFERQVAGRVAASLFVSEAEADLFRRQPGVAAERVHGLGNGVDLDYFDPRRDHADPYAAGGPVLAFTGMMDYRANVAMEAFNEQELRDHLPYSILFNVFASRQDDFSEMLFPTTVVPPDQAGLDITVARMQVFNEVRHQASGAKIDFGKRNLIDAAIDHTILADEHTRLVPVVLEDGSNADKFVDEAVVPTFFQRVGNFDVPTSALKLDETIDLLGISQWQPLLGAGVIDHSDDVDARVSLEDLYVQTAANAPAVAFPVHRLARSSFTKTVEGNSREMQLTFNTTDLVIDKDSKAVDGSDVAAFAAIASGNYIVRLAVSVTGSLNVETGNIKVWSSSISVASIQDAAGTVIPRSEARPGDLVYKPGHIGIYAGGNQFVDAGNSRVDTSERNIYSGSWTFIRIGG